MKKFIFLIVALLILFTGTLGYTQYSANKNVSQEAETESLDFIADDPSEYLNESVDYDAIRALYNGSDIVATSNGRDVSWDEYFYWYNYNAQQIENYFMQMGMYTGTKMSWNDVDNESGITFAQELPEYAQHIIKQFDATNILAEEMGITLDEEDQKSKDLAIEEMKKTFLGDEATDEEFDAFLEENICATRDLYNAFMDTNILAEKTEIEFCSYEKLDSYEEDALKYLEENEYIHANHILLMTLDMMTGEELTEDEKAQKLKTAESICEELKKITDKDELLARFIELQEQYNEDTGVSTTDSGYTFKKNTMDENFDASARALEDYEVSDVVESMYGYHIIIKLPLDPKAPLAEYQSSASAENIIAEEKYMEAIEDKYNSIDFAVKDGIKLPEILDYIK